MKQVGVKMSKAYKCNYCDGYVDGEPAGSLYLYRGREASEDGKIDADLCNDCLEKFFSEFTLPEFYQ